jgi:glycerophosphoryl diester phosphodiesterase
MRAVMLNIAHKGGAGLRPENTLAAFANALDMGADGAELDAQLSRDGEVVVFHDFRLKSEICRGPDGRWIQKPTPRIKDLLLSELKLYDVGRLEPGSEYAREFPSVQAHDGERIPTLKEVVELVRKRPKPFILQVELKSSFSDRDLSADPVALADESVKVLRELNYLDRTIFVGFDWPALLHVMKIAPGTRCWFTTLARSWFEDGTPPEDDHPPAEPALQMLRYWANNGTSPWAGGYDAVNYGGSIAKAIKAAGGEGWFPPSRDATPERVAEARSLGLKVGVWTANEPADLKRLIALKLDAICTDRPDTLAGLMT